MSLAISPSRWLAAVATTMLIPASASACATCFGASDSQLAQGMNMGIFSLLLVLVAVFAGIVAFFVYLARRAALHAQTLASNPGLSETIK